MKRLFIAIPLPKQFLKVFSKYRDAMGKQTPWARWTAVANLHITVLFLGDVPEQVAPAVIDAIQSVCKETKLFSLEFKNITYAPPARPPRMIWGVFTESHEYQKLVNRLVETLQTIMPSIKDSFHEEKIPHVTLARFKYKISPQKLVRIKNAGLEGEGMSITSFILMESNLTPNGPEYKVVEEFQFGT